MWNFTCLLVTSARQCSSNTSPSACSEKSRRTIDKENIGNIWTSPVIYHRGCQVYISILRNKNHRWCIYSGLSFKPNVIWNLWKYLYTHYIWSKSRYVTTQATLQLICRSRYNPLIKTCAWNSKKACCCCCCAKI